MCKINLKILWGVNKQRIVNYFSFISEKLKKLLERVNNVKIKEFYFEFQNFLLVARAFIKKNFKILFY